MIYIVHTLIRVYQRIFIQIYLSKDLFSVLEKVINSGNVDRACLEFREAAAVAIFAVKSKARPGLDRTFFATFFGTFSPFYPDSYRNH